MVDVIVVNGREAVKCVHCDGTGMCKKYGTNIDRNGDRVSFCTNCGNGVPETYRVEYWDSKPIRKQYGGQTPGCKICGGKGYN